MQPDRADASAQLRELIARSGAGDHAAFAQVYQRTQAHLFGVALRILGREQAAEDVLQEAFVSIWNHAAAYRPQVGGQDIQPMTWLIAIVRNKALDALRARSRRAETELDEDGAGPRLRPARSTSWRVRRRRCASASAWRPWTAATGRAWPWPITRGCPTARWPPPWARRLGR